MDAISFMTLSAEALRTVAFVAGPPIAAAFVVGGLVALLQSVTQIQEMTITFVPKIIAIFLIMAATGATAMDSLQAFGLRTMDLIREYRHVAGGPG